MTNGTRSSTSLLRRMKDDYASSAGVYDLIIEPLNRPLRWRAVKMLDVQPGQLVLDVCCGTGPFLERAQERGARGWGVDLSGAMLRRAAAKAGPGFGTCQGDALRLPFRDGSFDLAHISLALHEMIPERREQLLGEMLRVLRPGGKMLLVDFHHGPREGLNGHLVAGVIRGIEFVAGIEHYRNSRQFLASGTLPALLGRVGLAPAQTVVRGSGNLACVLVIKDGHAAPSAAGDAESS